MRPDPSPSSEPTPEACGEHAHGWEVPRDIVIAPRRAFAGIAAHGAWLPSYVVLVVCGLAYVALAAPALEHATFVELTRNGARALTAPAPQLARESLIDSAVASAVQPLWIAAFLGATACLLARLRDRGHPAPRLGVCFALAVASAIPAALGNLLSGIPVAARGATHYPTFGLLATALPINLGVFAPEHAETQRIFLASFGLFDLWSAILFADGLATIAEIPLAVGLVLALAVDVLAALYFLLG
ncbi:MAG: hypothetical protein ACREM2_03800 [Vulcanimicrobiaceae bacterium]